ncbi:MAG: methanogenesis marker 12 protein [Methanospirillum sp.]
MYLGIDHGTTAMRFATESGTFKLPRADACAFELGALDRLGPIGSIEGCALCYSMGDGISAITPIERVRNRGVVSREGAGEHIGGGTRVFDVMAASGIPTVVIPGLHRGSPTDPRFKAYSHQTSPEKLGIAYLGVLEHGPDVVVADISSNTVSLLVRDGRVVGAFDACLFAPGMRHGALDVDAIRRIDLGEETANQAFLRAGVEYTMPESERLRTVAMFAAMECAALLLLAPDATVVLAGSLAPLVADEVAGLIDRPVAVHDEWAAAEGLVRIARDVFGGADEILGIPVDR